MTDRAPVSAARAWWTLIVLSITLAFNFLDRQVLTLLVTPIKADLGLSDTQISLLIGLAFVIFYLGVGIPAARLVDRGPRKWLLGGALALWSGMTMMCGLAGSFWQLALARMGVGIGESCCGPAVYSMTSDLFRRERMGMAISVINLGTVVGSGMALLVGGTIITWLATIGDIGFPVLGTLRPWQVTFLIVGAPGVVWAIVLATTVREPPRRVEGRSDDVPSYARTFAFLWAWKAVYVPLIAAMGIKAMLSFGTAVWSPSLLERKFGLAPGQPGIYIGVAALVVSPLGMVFGGWLADRMLAAGRQDAHARIIWWASMGVVPFAVLAPLMPTIATTVLCLAGALLIGSIGNAPAMAALQLITPGRMRGTFTAIYLAIFNIVGYGLGPVLVAVISDRIFGGPAMLGSAMAVVAILLGPLGALLAYTAISPFGRALAAARTRESDGL